MEYYIVNDTDDNLIAQSNLSSDTIIRCQLLPIVDLK